MFMSNSAHLRSYNIFFIPKFELGKGSTLMMPAEVEGVVLNVSNVILHTFLS